MKYKVYKWLIDFFAFDFEFVCKCIVSHQIICQFPSQILPKFQNEEMLLICLCLFQLKIHIFQGFFTGKFINQNQSIFQWNSKCLISASQLIGLTPLQEFPGVTVDRQ